MLTQERLKRLFIIDLETGIVTNKVWRTHLAPAGARAGSPTGHGYRRIVIDSKKCYEHHIVWCYFKGDWPSEIDHIDGNRSNNALSNLRVATRSQNSFNAKKPTGQAGLRGAYLDKRTMNWYSHIQIGGVVKHLGMFGSAEEAHKAFMAEVDRRHGEFALCNRPSNRRI